MGKPLPLHRNSRMNVDQFSNTLTNRFMALGAIDPVNFADRVLAAVREWLAEINDLPSKVVVLQATAQALDRAFAGIDTPGPDVIVEPILKSAILSLVEFTYKQLAGDGGVSV